MNKGIGVNDAILQNMARFYLKTLFYGIPEVEVVYAKKNELDDAVLGEFGLDKNESYCEEDDELLNYPGYQSRYKSLWDGLGGCYLNTEFSWMDPENHPEVKIRINPRCRENTHGLVATLLHELLHYFFWYTGREYHDESREFLDECKKMGLPTNYDREWKDGGWVNTYDQSKVEPYVRMYADYVADKFIESLKTA